MGEEKFCPERILWLWNQRAHRSGHQVRPLNGHLRHGLLRSSCTARLASAVPEVAEGANRVAAQAQEGGRHEVVPDQVRWHHSEQLGLLVPCTLEGCRRVEVKCLSG